MSKEHLELNTMISSLSKKQIALLLNLCNNEGRMGYIGGKDMGGLTASLSRLGFIEKWGRIGRSQRWIVSKRVKDEHIKTIRKIGGTLYE